MSDVDIARFSYWWTLIWAIKVYFGQIVRCIWDINWYRNKMCQNIGLPKINWVLLRRLSLITILWSIWHGGNWQFSCDFITSPKWLKLGTPLLGNCIALHSHGLLAFVLHNPPCHYVRHSDWSIKLRIFWSSWDLRPEGYILMDFLKEPLRIMHFKLICLQVLPIKASINWRIMSVW